MQKIACVGYHGCIVRAKSRIRHGYAPSPLLHEPFHAAAHEGICGNSACHNKVADRRMAQKRAPLADRILRLHKGRLAEEDAGPAACAAPTEAAC